MADPNQQFDPNSDPNTYGGGGGTTSTSATTAYLGDVPHAQISGPLNIPVPFTGHLNYTVQGYKKGDQVGLLPKDGHELATLQLALIQAGYITDSQAKMLVLGSPDQVTTLAFSKLLATANLSGVQWKDALSSRLAFAGKQAPEVAKVPPLTVQLTNPEDIKATLQKTAQTLLGGYMSDDQANAFVSQFQAQQTAAQTQAYYQQYNPTEGGYGPGGVTVAPPDIGAAAQDYAKTTEPNQYQATQFGATVEGHLANLRSSGYLR